MVFACVVCFIGGGCQDGTEMKSCGDGREFKGGVLVHVL